MIPQVIHPSLLEDPHEKAMLRFYTTGQLVLIDVKSKTAKKIGVPGMIRSADASPDGQYFRVTHMTEPFSYLVPVSSFGSVQELWDISGKVVTTLNKQPLREGEASGDGDVPTGGGRGAAQQPASDTGKRNVNSNPVGSDNKTVYLSGIRSPGANWNMQAPRPWVDKLDFESSQRDGIKFWVDLTLPADWKPGTRLPGIVWFYPREYTTQAEYDRSRLSTNINKFPDTPALRPASSTRLWVTQGYAVIEPDCPIMGAAGKMNDNYARDLAENLELIVNAMVDQGYVDRDRVGVGGHSYGAFSTVNALTLTSVFKAGIGGTGCTTGR